MSCHLCPKETSFWMWGDALELNDNIQFSKTILYLYIYIYRCSYRIILIIKHVPVKFLCFSDVLTTSLGISSLISGTDDNQLPLKVMRVPIARLSVDLALEPLSKSKRRHFHHQYLETHFCEFVWECCLNIKKSHMSLKPRKKNKWFNCLNF